MESVVRSDLLHCSCRLAPPICLVPAVHPHAGTLVFSAATVRLELSCPPRRANLKSLATHRAHGSPHRERAAYRWSAETSAYVDPSVQRQGVGKALYLALFEVLAARGYCNAFAGMTLPNDASAALHRSVGFEPIGVFRRVGWKFGTWHDVAWSQRRLRDAPPA